MTEQLTIGVDVGGTNLRFGVFRGNDCLDSIRHEVDLHAKCAAAADSESAAQLFTDLLEAGIAQLRHQHPEIVRVGVAVPGFVNAKGVLLQSPNIPQLINFDLQSAVQNACQLPVLIENDANAAGYGEFWEEKQENPELRDLLYIGLGTGVGGGWVHDDRPWRGEHGTAMEIGHLIVVPGGRRCGCGNQGCLEQYASARGIQSSYVELTGTAPDTAVIAQMACDGRPEASQTFQMAGDYLGQALASILKVADVRVIRVGGGVSAAWDCFAPALMQRLDADLIPALRGEVEVKRGNDDDLAGMRGVALLADQELSQ
ncbi:ROK family protein [Acidithiobacillus thiooxidans]|uniref:ROK family transcriptional regulator n=1 Tax=Acidithiobacillus thiooxidans ATCC 19377 TaxID=637390 RepID=A0A5P9XV08_ACITH|nr:MULTISPECIES: ROK family protein [Acidithiobacillus]MBU2742763.1 ROK family protein [Acidithiobacillus albertensis]MBU2835171.1 ROK family protein [Acidithiobacillus thiooxidans]MBU2841114.1 ROK family protein [Acidithiobacillus thiooxidans]MDA8175891.1 ROK family protein [Acidithiobacillus sp.]QFX97489.1 ROK family transcriptional regulator [Acidithiobacillus thiooxidans ATCC 19377]